MFYTLVPVSRPNMAVPASQKGEKYHGLMGRHLLAGMNAGPIQRMHAKSIAAEKAYNDEIVTEQDIDGFLMDESRNARNRVMWDFNMVKPIVEQYRGSMIQSQFNASVQTVSKSHARTRRQNGMARKMLMHNIAGTSSLMKRAIGEPNGVGKTLQETMGMYENTFEDGYVRAANHLLEQAALMCDPDRYKSEDAMRFALCGILAEIERDMGSYIRTERIHPRDFIYDTNCKLPDFSDAMFLGVAPLMPMPRIAKLWNIDKAKLQAIESAIKTHASAPYAGGGSTGFDLMSQNAVRVASMYWIDTTSCTFGYINGDGDVPTLVKVGEKDEYGKEYSENDLINPPKSELTERTFGKNKTARRDIECPHYIDFVPWEYMSGSSSNKDTARRYKDGELTDLILDYGVYPLVEYNPFDIDKCELPIKATCFALAAGEVVSPVQAVLQPNRFIARVLGAMEEQFNASEGKTPFVDMDLVDTSLTIDDVDVYRKMGRTVPMRAGGRGVQNAIGYADGTPGSGTYAMLQIVQAAQDLTRTITGVHAPLTGESQKDQLVGVTEILVQRGALMQEGFYDAIGDLYLRRYRFLATAGFQYYLQRPDVLSDMIGEDDLLHIYMSEDFAMERMNATVKRDNPERTRRQAANAWLDQLLQIGLIDRKKYFDLYNRSYIEDVAPALRQYAAELEQAEMESARQQQQQQLMAGLQAEKERLDEKEDQVRSEELDIAKTMAKEGAKEQANVTRERTKAELRPAEPPMV